jgi:hypothetical protein
VDDNSAIRAWDARTGRVVFEQLAPDSTKLSSAFISEDGSIIAASFSNGDTTVQSTTDSTMLMRQTLRVQLSGDNLKEMAQSGLLSGADRAKIREGAQTLEVALGAMTMAVSPDAKWLALGMPDGAIRVVNIVTGTPNKPIRLNRRRAQQLAFSPNSAFVAVIEAGEYRALNVYQTETGEHVMGLSLGSQSAAQLHALKNGKGFATIDTTGRIMVHPFFQDWRDLIAYLAREFPEALTTGQQRAFFIE